MNSQMKIAAGCCAALALLAGCGGGGGSLDERAASITVTDSSASGLDGVYGYGSFNSSAVVKVAAAGGNPELCAFTFDGADRVGGNGSASGDVRYQPNTDSLYRLVLNVRGREFSTANGDGDRTDVHHSKDYVEINDKKLTATDGSGETLRATGLITMRGNRPEGC